MQCPTCDHTMEGIGYCHVSGMEGQAFHCPRCGTIKTPDGKVVTPGLVDRCREWETSITKDDDELYTPTVRKVLTYNWRKLGIAESIRVPKDRP